MITHCCRSMSWPVVSLNGFQTNSLYDWFSPEISQQTPTWKYSETFVSLRNSCVWHSLTKLKYREAKIPIRTQTTDECCDKHFNVDRQAKLSRLVENWATYMNKRTQLMFRNGKSRIKMCLMAFRLTVLNIQVLIAEECFLFIDHKGLNRTHKSCPSRSHMKRFH